MVERVTFPSSTGPRLAGVIDRPDGPIRGWGVFSHGFTLGKDSPAASRICKQLASDGIGMLRFDALGLGDSEGDWGDGSFTHKANDIIEACKFMAGRGTPADILIGHSFGGAAVIAAARQSPGVRAVVTVGAPFDPVHVEHQYDACLEQVFAEGSGQWMVGGKTLTLKRAFVEDVRATDLRDKIKALKMPLLILHSPTDNTVGIQNASDIFRAARHPRSFVSLEGSEHLLTGPGQAKRAGRIIGAWADAYLGER
ncbi:MULTISPECIES: S9 family peptidase [unclassified Mycolicibacterium]|uniref:alpha/beta hydrolase family protein n=1 Tax=unclassified Mycolicibacterium TaxID=2636767 RepID=UPI0012DED409|nr:MULTISPECIES: alpha/beta fold hydrolase [unclassified Mycolicibacterium]MUL83043.1 lysophospholipase [Mycolicibacterium sp. CBMA 329]MUL89378.1 lysophospholipase [Mycolicibacterium sp. CBMA 331]MUL99067.1 lysophospholipase [Mycolicibacterium sp. CBMA 334]MUM29966.1 lysophospholipase [Mycolicibacterium sp. CBMA 295]MUM38894.1 lysophospholipase [Mycolicibacterium sp. CBMA 247]